MTELVWTETAVRDLTAISSFIARDSDSYARATIDRLIAAAEPLIEFPRSGRYRVIHRTRPTRIEILAVIHCAGSRGPSPPPRSVARPATRTNAPSPGTSVPVHQRPRPTRPSRLITLDVSHARRY